MSFDAGSVIGKLELSLEGWKKSVEAVKKDQESMTGFAMRHGQEIQDLGKKFALAGAAITAALSAIVISTGHAGDQFDEMSAKTGISTETLSTLKLAADKSGTSIDSVAAGMKFLATQMIETSNAGDKSKTVLGALGVEATDSTGKLRPMNDVLFDVAEKFKGMEDGALKTKLAVVIFGRAGMDMIPILNLGRKGLEENEAAAKKLGIEWSGPSAKAAAVFADSIVDLKASGTGLNKMIGEALMPITQKFIEHATDAIVKVKDWAKENPELSKSILSFAGAGGVALTVMGTLLIAIGTLAKNLQLLKISASVPIIITVGIAGGVALAKALEEIRDFYEKNVSHRYIAQEDRDWQGLIRTLGEWSTIAESIHDAFTKQNGYSIESGKILGQLDVIWQKYGNSTRQAMEAILKGEAGPKVKQLLIDLMNAHGGAAQLAGVHAEAEKKVEKAAVALDPALQAILDSLDKNKEKTKSLAEELNLTFTSGLKKRVEDIAAALKKYGDDLPESEVRRLKAEQRELNDNLATGGLVLGMVEQRLKALENPLGVIAVKMEALGKTGAQAFGKMGIESRTTTEAVKSEWNDLYNDLTQGWADTLQEWFEGTLTFKDFLGEMWDDIKKSFFTVIAEMTAKWAIDFVKNLITSAATTATSVGASMASIGTTVGSIAVSLATAVASVLVTLATGIAEAADILAASAESLLIVGAIAVAIYAGFLQVKTLWESFGNLIGGGGGKQTDVTYWLKMMHENIQRIHDFMLGDFREAYMNSFKSEIISIKEKIEDIRGCVCGPMLDALKGLAGYQHGGYVPETGLALLHAGEYVLPPAANQGFVNAAAPAMAALGISSAVNNYSITIQAIDGPSVERLFKGRGRDIIEQMFRQNKKGLTRNVNKFLEDMA